MTPIEQARAVASAVPDPELPDLTIADLGILRDVAIVEGSLVVSITPTYPACPAMRLIADDLRRQLQAAGFEPVTVRLELAPPWSSDAITPEGRRKLAAAGIAPPTARGPVRVPLMRERPGVAEPALGEAAVPCPRCGAEHTERLAAFGPTACTALRRCLACGEPFEHVRQV